jgi:LysR family transcriptional regulator, hydrogen peroxide-inducible genes activator
VIDNFDYPFRIDRKCVRMQTYLPTLKQLQYLVALHEHGHFGRAADASFVTQSTLSAGIRELESLLGLMLVERTRRVVRFTQLGERIVAKAHRVLREAEELAGLAAAAAAPLSGELRMSVIPTIAPFLLPTLLPRLREDKPDLQLYLREEPSQAACDSLHHGHVDCVLLALPYLCGDVESQPLFEDRLLIALPAAEGGHYGESIAPDTLDPDRLLLLEDGHCLKDHALSVCNRPELRAGARMMGTSLHTLVQMVDNGLGITFLPQTALDAGILARTSIITRPIDAPNDSRTIALVWRRNSPRVDEFRMLAGILQRHWAR